MSFKKIGVCSIAAFALIGCGSSTKEGKNNSKKMEMTSFNMSSKGTANNIQINNIPIFIKIHCEEANYSKDDIEINNEKSNFEIPNKGTCDITLKKFTISNDIHYDLVEDKVLFKTEANPDPKERANIKVQAAENLLYKNELKNYSAFLSANIINNLIIIHISEFRGIKPN
ncbi:MAG: hypothetical protein K2X69_12260 [Silvanigrellaceae bacterium]|jgi:hypothetical protein|nr:hypothetical protein [Silvanigrellaceae bacterium]